MADQRQSHGRAQKPARRRPGVLCRTPTFPGFTVSWQRGDFESGRTGPSDTISRSPTRRIELDTCHGRATTTRGTNASAALGLPRFAFLIADPECVRRSLAESRRGKPSWRRCEEAEAPRRCATLRSAALPRRSEFPLGCKSRMGPFSRQPPRLDLPAAPPRRARRPSSSCAREFWQNA